MSPRWNLYRGLSRIRCRIGVHRWRGYHDLGDGVNVLPISGYKKPHGIRDFRLCTWCGNQHGVVRIGDDRMRTLRWRRHRA